MILGVLALIVSKQEAQMCQKWFLACCSSIKLPVLFIFGVLGLLEEWFVLLLMMLMVTINQQVFTVFLTVP